MQKALLFLIFLTGSLAVFAQEESYKSVIKLNPPGIGFSSGIITYERIIGTNSSFEIGPAVDPPLNIDWQPTDHFSLGVFVGYRYYISKELVAPEGLYISPGLSYIRGTAKVDYGLGKEVTKTSSYQVQAVAGYQWIIKQRFTLDANAGARYRKHTYKGGIYVSPIHSGVFPSIGLGLGFIF